MPQRGGDLNNVYNNLYGGDRKGLYTMGPSGGGRRNPMIYGKPKPKWPKIVLAVVVVLLVVLCVRQFACGGILPHQEPEQQQTEQQTSQGSQDGSGNATQTSSSGDVGTEIGADDEEEQGNPDVNGVYDPGVDAQLQVSVIGDCTLGDDENSDVTTNFTKIFTDLQSTNYFFANVRRFLNKDTVSICNLEGPLSTQGTRADRDFAFRGDPSYAGILAEGGVEAANIANNHIYDYGEAAYEDTKKALEDAKLTSFGFDRVTTYEAEGLKIGMYGINTVDEESGNYKELAAENIKALQQKGCAVIVGYYHWGETGSNTVTSEQVELAHDAIDNGCDLVVGSHPHVLQGVEKYNNRYICYSLSNFCYGGNDHPRDFDTMIFQQTFTIKDGQPIFDDKTLKDADIVPCTVSSSTDVNNYQPTPIGKKKVKDMVEKLNGYSKELSGTSVEFATKLNDYDCAAVK